MLIRNIASAAALFAATASLVACGPSRQQPDAGTEADAGCVGAHCNPGGNDAGTDGGSNPGGGDGGYDGGLLTVTLEDLRGPNVPFGANVEVKDVVVHTVSYSSVGSQGDVIADFWVSDPANPPYGLWVTKHYQDLPGPYMPEPGDKITLNGYFGTGSKFDYPDAYRRKLSSKKLPSGSFAQLKITEAAQVSVPNDINVQAGQFGNADGGTTRPNPEYAGSRVFVQGPVEIINAEHPAFTLPSSAPGKYGFEVTGGIFVSNEETFAADGGCPWQLVAVDAGTQGQKVVFQGGISGVWDTYSISECAPDAGTNLYTCFKNEAAKVPGTTNDYTYALYPQSCEDFHDPVVVPE